MIKKTEKKNNVINKNKRIFKLVCKHCGNTMNYSPNIDFNQKGYLIKLKNKRKRCVYCGKTFLVREGLRKIKNSK